MLITAMLVLTAWRLPAVFDYLLLTPFLGTALGGFLWLLLMMLGVDAWSLRLAAGCILTGIVGVSFIVRRCTK